MSLSITPKSLWFISGGMWIKTLVVMVACYLLLHQDSQSVFSGDEPVSVVSSSHSFKQDGSVKEALQTRPFQLSQTVRTIKLPDMRSVFVYYGCNERPDRDVGTSRIQFGIRGSPTVHSVLAEQPVYVRFEGHSNKWVFSDSPTVLFATFSLQGSGVFITITVLDEQGNPIKTPRELYSFSVIPSALPQTASPQSWMIGEDIVDNAILEHQGAVWWGYDEVVRCLGGDDMKEQGCRQRVQFGVDSDAYVLWVGEGDCFAYNQNRWEAVTPGEDSLGRPLLRAKSIEQHSIHFDLWNADGTAHVVCVLPKRDIVGEAKVPEIKLLGAKSRRNWIAEIQGKRMILSPDDWVVMTRTGLVKLDTTQNLEDFIEGRLMGDLFVFSGIEIVNKDSCITGTFFDISRTYQEPFAVSLYRSWKPKEPVQNMRVDEDVEENDDDDDDDEEGLFEEIDDDEDYEDE